MPNRTGQALKGRRKSQPETLDQIIEQSEENSEVTSTATDERPQIPDFVSLVEDAPADFKPKRSPAGRKRIPSQFDELLPRLYDENKKSGHNPKMIPHDGNVEVDDFGKATPESIKKSNAHVIIRELRKSQHHFGYGMDLYVTGTHVVFTVRDLQKRKNPDGSEAVAEGEIDGSEEDLDDEFDDEVEDED